MNSFFSPNLTRTGRIVRGIGAVLAFLAAGFSFTTSWLLSLLLATSGVFMLFEALRGWCLLRACGIKTRL